MPAGSWSAATRSWWETWARAEQAARFSPTAWQRIAMLVPLVEEYYTKPSRLLLYEIARHESKLGATPEDMIRLGWKLEGPKPPEADDVDALYPQVEVT